MFFDDLPPQQQAAPAPMASSSSSTTEHNSINDEKTMDRGETEEAQSKWHGTPCRN